MTAEQTAARHVRAILARMESHLGLQPGALERLDGHVVLLTAYEDEAAIRFLRVHDPLSLAEHRRINAAAEKLLRAMGAEVRIVMIRLNDYFDWLVRFGLSDCTANRAQFISWLTAPEPKFTPSQPNPNNEPTKK